MDHYNHARQIWVVFCFGTGSLSLFFFSLSTCVNTCFITKVFPYLTDLYKYKFRISATQSLGLGLYGSGQNGEHSNKQAKKTLFSWTHPRFGFLEMLAENLHIPLHSSEVS